MKNLAPNQKVQAIEKSLDSVLMNVTKVETESLFINKNLKVASDKACAIIRENKVVGLVSENFSLIKPSDFHFEMMDQFQKNDLGFLVPDGRIDNKGNWEIRYTSEVGAFSANKKLNDQINPFASFSNGLGGTQSGHGGVGAKRLVCTNGMTSLVGVEIFAQKVRNTKNMQNLKLGIDFESLIEKYLRFFESFDEVIKEQEKMSELEFKKELVLPVFYELTKGTKFPESKFQPAFERISFEAKELGYTEMNSYLALAGLNYILEHDSMALDINQVKEIDFAITKNAVNLDVKLAMQNFNALVMSEYQRVEDYKLSHEGSEPRGKRKILELDLASW